MDHYNVISDIREFEVNENDAFTIGDYSFEDGCCPCGSIIGSLSTGKWMTYQVTDSGIFIARDWVIDTIKEATQYDFLCGKHGDEIAAESEEEAQQLSKMFRTARYDSFVASKCLNTLECAPESIMANDAIVFAVTNLSCPSNLTDKSKMASVTEAFEKEANSYFGPSRVYDVEIPNASSAFVVSTEFGTLSGIELLLSPIEEICAVSITFDIDSADKEVQEAFGMTSESKVEQAESEKTSESEKDGSK